MSVFSASVKRGVDLVLAGIGLLFSIPVQLVVAAKVRQHLGSPVLFKQKRPGKNGELFDLYKFRSMLPVDEAKGHVSNAERMTPFGARLRATSLDELPSLWNVVKGDMSLVGPRPLRAEYLERYNPRQATRHQVRPGITGLAQVSGRNALSWEDRLELDAQYVERHSLALDLVILWKTLFRVLKKEGIAEEGNVAMSEFLPSSKSHASSLTLRPLMEGDLATRVRWLSDPSIRQGISIEFWPEAQSMKAWFSRACLDATRRDYVLADGDSVMAMVGLTNISEASAELYIYVDPNRHRMGYGKKSMYALFSEAAALGMNHLTLETRSEVAKNMYAGLGFTIDWVDHGKYHMSKVIS